MLILMLLYVMYVWDLFLYSMGVCNILWDVVLID